MSAWTGTHVRWKGVIVGGYAHGYALAALDCQRRGIALGDWSGPSGANLDRALEARVGRFGVIRADLSGKIIGEGNRLRLSVDHVHAAQFEPMSEEEHRQLFASIGL